MSVVAHAAGLAAAGGLLLAAPAPNVALHAPGHSPQIKTHWNYSVTVTRGGKPAADRVDDLRRDRGGVHIVQFGNTTKDVKAYPFNGTFRDFVIWPADSRGIPLTFRLTVKSGPTKKVIGYHVTPH